MSKGRKISSALRQAESISSKRRHFVQSCVYYLLSGYDAATVQHVYVLPTFVHEATDESVVAEDDGGHFGDVLVALIVSDVTAVIHQTGHQVTFPKFLCCTFFNLGKSDSILIPLQQLYSCFGKL